MRYCDIRDLARELEVLAAKGNRIAQAHAQRIWRARRRWGGYPTPANWEAISVVGERAGEWLRAQRAVEYQE